MRRIFPPIVGLLVALIIGDLLILTFGENPYEVYRLMLRGTWGNAYGFGQVLYKATTLAFTGLAVSVGLRGGLFNVGAEGQLTLAGFAAAALGGWLPASTPWAVSFGLMVGAAVLVGGGTGALAGAAKARFGAHEVIVTILLNFIVWGLVSFAVSTSFHVPETLHTAPIETGTLRRLSEVFPVFAGSAANTSTVLLFGCLLIISVLFRFSRWGFEMDAIGKNVLAAKTSGLSVGAVWTRTFFISGALSGLASLNFVLGYKGYYEEGMALGAGFMGVAVALVGKESPLGVFLAALLFATLSQGGFAINAVVPKQVVDVLIASMILAVGAATPIAERLVLRREEAP